MAIYANGVQMTRVFINGTQVTGKVYAGATIVFQNFNPTLMEGADSTYIENTSFVAGYYTGTGAITENTTDAVLSSQCTEVLATGADGVVERTWVSDVAIDLTDYTTLSVSWRNLGTATLHNQSIVAVSTNKTSSSATYDARTLKTSTFALTTSTLDVTALNGSYYVRIHARDNSAVITATSNIHVVKIWLS